MPDPAVAEPIILWRAYVPRWAHDPLSGAGAARFGGRWNPVGMPALYASLEMSTAWAEYNQGLVQHPALIARLQLTGAKLCDLTRDTVLAELGIDPTIHDTQWRDLLIRSEIPSTYTLCRRLIALGHDSVIYPSAISKGGRCVALWRWNIAGGPKITVTDPEGRMPHDERSWR